jgi:methylmalonyl-CoA mutase C-terminal domain/subunit
MTKKKVIIAMFGFDGHDHGAKLVSKWLEDGGFEVVYLGCYNSAEKVIKAALEEDADIIGGSFLGGGHLLYVERLAELIKEHGMGKVKLIVGGMIPPYDIPKLEELGVKEVFPPGTRKEDIIQRVKALV